MAAIVAIFGFLIGIFAIFDLQVAPMPQTQFQMNLFQDSEELLKIWEANGGTDGQTTDNRHWHKLTRWANKGSPPTPPHSLFPLYTGIMGTLVLHMAY